MWYNIDTIKKEDNEMKIIYQADDGARFESELECIEYERSRKICNAISERKLQVLTYNGEVIREREFLDHRDLDDAMGHIYYFHCNDKEVLEILSEFFAEDFEENVTYYFDEDEDRWIELDDCIYNYRSLLSDLIKVQVIIMDGITT